MIFIRLLFKCLVLYDTAESWSHMYQIIKTLLYLLLLNYLWQKKNIIQYIIDLSIKKDQNDAWVLLEMMYLQVMKSSQNSSMSKTTEL